MWVDDLSPIFFFAHFYDVYLQIAMAKAEREKKKKQIIKNWTRVHWTAWNDQKERHWEKCNYFFIDHNTKEEEIRLVMESEERKNCNNNKNKYNLQ